MDGFYEQPRSRGSKGLCFQVHREPPIGKGSTRHFSHQPIVNMFLASRVLIGSSGLAKFIRETSPSIQLFPTTNFSLLENARSNPNTFLVMISGNFTLFISKLWYNLAFIPLIFGYKFFNLFFQERKDVQEVRHECDEKELNEGKDKNMTDDEKSDSDDDGVTVVGCIPNNTA